MLIDGRWEQEADHRFVDGAFQREASQLETATIAETQGRLQRSAGGVVLVVSRSCPWSHRAVLVHAIRNLSHRVPLAWAGGPRVEGYALECGAELAQGAVTAPRHVHELYSMTAPRHTGRATVPVLFDVAAGKILLNDSASIMIALDVVSTARDFTLMPAPLLEAMATLDARLDERLCNAVYRAGLAQAQSAYDSAVADVFDTLERLEARLTHSRYLFGNTITATDLRLFTTLCRFDAIYATHFRCTRRRLVDHKALWAYARDIMSWPGIAATFDVDANLEGYYLNDGTHNPHGIVAQAPTVDWTTAHGRDALGPAQVFVVGRGPVDAGTIATGSQSKREA